MKLPELPRTPAACSRGDESELNKLGAALDQIIEECDPWEAGLVDWAMENGYPALETVLRYAR
jgi:hypothetical protein